MRKLSILAACAALTLSASAQIEEISSWRFGFTGGAHASKMHISPLDKDVYPTDKALFSPMGSFYIQKSFGPEMNFAIRPEVALTSRGGRIDDIMRNKLGYYQEKGIDNIFYKVKADYVDLRLPVMYRFGNTSSAVRPYLYVAPILGFAYGGNLTRATRLISSGGQTSSDNLTIPTSKANLNPLYFSGAFGMGLDFQLNVGNHVCTIGLEAMYEHGFTNTFGDDKLVTNRVPIAPDEELDLSKDGTRRFSGLEFKLTLGIPFSIFGSPAPKEIESEPIEEEPVVTEAEEEADNNDERDCYTLAEINDLMGKGESVFGKTICDIDGAVEFNSSESTILPESYDYLNRLAETLIRTNGRIKVIGHTDSTGPDELNMELSRDRAVSVVNYLKDHGVSASKLFYDYYGESRPIDTNATPEGRRHNRRVEFEIMGE